METIERKEKVKAAVEILKAVTEAIRALKQIPSGELYATLMNYISLQDYETIIGIIQRAGLINVTNHIITWTGK